MNKWCGTGKVVNEIESGIGEDGEVKYVRFTIAARRSYAKDGQQDADFVRCVAFGATAKFINTYVTKGTKLEVTGPIETGSYEKDGQKYYTWCVRAEQVGFAESKRTSEENGGVKPAPDDLAVSNKETIQIGEEEIEIEDLPFN